MKYFICLNCGQELKTEDNLRIPCLHCGDSKALLPVAQNRTHITPPADPRVMRYRGRALNRVVKPL
jgi:DNA-directed RNA polymerase subunit RPC12/RpoP